MRAISDLSYPHALNNLYFGSDNGGFSSNRTWFWQGKWYNQDSFDTPDGFLMATEGTLNQSIDADPNFVGLSFSDSSVDLHLVSSSPAINRGRSLPQKFVGVFDIDDEKRHKQKIDMGADEWHSSR